jgi:2'-5' RNA ligase
MRLFTALDLPPTLVDNLDEVLRRLKPAARIRWSPTENLHITIKFIGEFPEERLGELKAALGEVPKRAAIPVSIRRVGFFPHGRAPHSFWCGVEAPGLEVLAADTDRAVSAFIVSRETGFSPHLTLARIPKGGDLRRLREVIAALPSLEFGEFEARSFFLFQSKPTSSGSMYTKLAEFPLPPT